MICGDVRDRLELRRAARETPAGARAAAARAAISSPGSSAAALPYASAAAGEVAPRLEHLAELHERARVGRVERDRLPEMRPSAWSVVSLPAFDAGQLPVEERRCRASGDGTLVRGRRLVEAPGVRPPRAPPAASPADGGTTSTSSRRRTSVSDGSRRHRRLGDRASRRRAGPPRPARRPCRPAPARIAASRLQRAVEAGDRVGVVSLGQAGVAQAGVGRDRTRRSRPAPPRTRAARPRCRRPEANCQPRCCARPAGLARKRRRRAPETRSPGNAAWRPRRRRRHLRRARDDRQSRPARPPAHAPVTRPTSSPPGCSRLHSRRGTSASIRTLSVVLGVLLDAAEPVDLRQPLPVGLDRQVERDDDRRTSRPRRAVIASTSSARPKPVAAEMHSAPRARAAAAARGRPRRAGRTC